MATKKKYLIDYQLEETEPGHEVVRAEDEEQAVKELKKKLKKQMVEEFFLEQDEAADLVATLTVLEIKKA